MSKAAFDAKLAAIDALRTEEPGPQRDATLRKALADRNNYAAAKAAQIATELLAAPLIPDLLAAFDRFMLNPVKSDPQCWAKIAIAKALSALGHEERDVYLRGLRHVQMEPVWGGRQDTAGPLRANCALALVGCQTVTDHDALEYLIEPLFDEDKTVRVEAARAIARIDRREAALILRTRALSSDSEPEPLGALYAGILTIEGKHGTPFVARFLSSAGDPAHEAALALGATHELAAFEVLRSALEQQPEPALRTTLLTAIALTRLPEAVDFLIAEVESGSPDALPALATIPLTEAQQARLDEVSPRED